MDGDFLGGEIDFALLENDPYVDDLQHVDTSEKPPFDCFTEPITSIPMITFKRQKRDLLKDRPITIANISHSHVEKEKRPSQGPILRMMPNISWFNISDIHNFEKLALPEFFDGNPLSRRTPEMYKDIRNYMIDTYQSNPARYLSVSQCRMELSGDANAIIKVYAYLEQLGLINYATVPETHGVPNPKISDDFLENLIPPGSRQTPSSHDVKNKSDVVETVCCKQCQSDCTKLRYYNRNHDHYYICFNCYASGNFPETMFSSEFDKLDVRDLIVIEDDEPWDEIETFKLLEGIELFGDDWDRISSYVGTKSKDECFYHFISMPIEDGFYKQSNLMSSNVKDIQDNIPFLDVNNPVMTLLVFLRDAISPQVSAAAAKAALQCFLELENDILAIHDSKENTKRASKLAMEAAVKKALELADRESQDIEKLTCEVIEAQSKKLEKKLAYFDRFEDVLQKEQETILHAKQKIDREMKYMYSDGFSL